jgi:hypothetical protein
MSQLVQWAAGLEPGTRRLFGFLQVDIAGHSLLPGAPDLIRATRGNLHAQISAILNQHDAQELFWAGDGGAYIFLLDGGRRVDAMVTAALQVLDSMRLFNNLSNLNMLDVPVRIRLSCHVGAAIWDRDLTNFYGRDVNYFLKAEREIGHENRLALTEEAYSDIVNSELRKLFSIGGTHDQYSINGRPYTRDLYLSLPVDTVARRDGALQNGDPPTVAEIAVQLRQARRVDLFMAGGDSFYRTLYEALRKVANDLNEDLQIRVLLRRSSAASARSVEQFQALQSEYGVKVDTKFYDWDFMIRGYRIDETVYFSYYLREAARLTGRYNPMVKLTADASALENFLIELFRRVFDAYFEATVPDANLRPFLAED